MDDRDRQNAVIGERLQRARKMRKRSAKSLAYTVGVSRPTLSNHERGVRSISVYLSTKYEQALGLRPGSLLVIDDEFEGAHFDPADLAGSVSNFTISAEESLGRLLDNEQRRELVKYIFAGAKQLLLTGAVEQIDAAVLQAGGIVMRTKGLSQNINTTIIDNNRKP